MILQRLAAYYERLLAEERIPPPGLQEKEIPWVVEIDRGGRFVALRRTGEGKRGRRFTVPAAVKKSVNIAANLMWGNAEYVFGAPRPGLTEKQAAKVPQRHAAFLESLRSLPEASRSDDGVAAVLTFLERSDFDTVKIAEGWQEMTESGGNISFRLVGDETLICERPAVRTALAADAEIGPVSNVLPRCLVTGVRSRPARLHPSIKGVRGAQTRGADIVSFNLGAFTSHGWKQGDNAPVSEHTANAYVAALNHLLDRQNDSHHLIEGDTTFVFWAAAKTPMEDRFAHLLSGLLDASTESDGTLVRQTFDSVRKGLKPHLQDETPFFVLGLAPNAARLAVRFWHEGTVAGMAKRIVQHFADLEIDGLWDRNRAPSLWALLGAAARNGDPKGLQDNLRGKLAAEIMEAILAARPYPATLLARTVERCRSEQSVRPVRAALVKAALNRRMRTLGSAEKEIAVSLDPNNPNPGYRLGRLFAVLEGIQRSAQPGINTTIRDRYFGAAVATPRAVFGELMKLKNAHLKKLRRSKIGLAVHFERLIDQIVAGMPADCGFPSHLSLDDQGRFIVGYHHQRSYRKPPLGEAPTETDAMPDLPEIIETDAE